MAVPFLPDLPPVTVFPDAQTMSYASVGMALVFGFWWLARCVSELARRRQSRREHPSRLPPDPGAGLAGPARVAYRACRGVGLVLEPFLPRSYRQLAERLADRAGLDWLTPAILAGAQAMSVVVSTLVLAGFARVLSMPLTVLVVLSALSAVWPVARLHELIRHRQVRIRCDLPTFLDLMVLAVSGGQSTSSALSMAVEFGPPGPMADEITRMLREVRAGRSRHDAMRMAAQRVNLPSVDQAFGALITAERQGADISDVLRAQADQRRQERFLDAEQRAMKAPVRMLLPLVGFIFPGTFLILMLPVALQLLDAGLL